MVLLPSSSGAFQNSVSESFVVSIGSGELGGDGRSVINFRLVPDYSKNNIKKKNLLIIINLRLASTSPLSFLSLTV